MKKYYASVEVFNSTLSGEWHSGDATSFYTDMFDTKEEALQFIKETEDSFLGREYNHYQVKHVLLSVDMEDSILSLEPGWNDRPELYTNMRKNY